jgi:putative ABC transport system permease protein
VARTAGDPLALARPVREAVWAVDPRQAVSQIDTLDNLLAGQVAKQRWSALLLGLFAGVALVLALVGIYGVLSYSVQQSTREIGIRMALGARRETVVRMVVARAARLALAGVAIGLALAWVATRALASLLHGVSATDPLTFAAMAALLLGAALLAGYLPARRATTVDPVTALRTP